MADFGDVSTWGEKVDQFLANEAVVPKEKPAELLEFQENLKNQRLKMLLDNLEPGWLEQGSVDWIRRNITKEKGRASFAYGSSTLPPTQEARKLFKGKKFISVPDPSYSDGRRRVMTPEYKAFVEKIQAKPNPAELRIKEGYKIAKSKLPKGMFPSVEQIRAAVPGVLPSLDTVYTYTEKNKLKLSQPRGGTIASILEAYEKVSDSGDRLLTKNVANKLPKNIKAKWKTSDLLKSYVGETLRKLDLPFEKSDLMHTTRSRTKAGKIRTAQAKIENIVDSDTLAKLKADIKKYKSGTIVGPQRTMHISDFRKYFPEGTSDVVVSRQVNRLGDEMGLKFKKISKPEELVARKLKYDILKEGDPKGIAKTMTGTKDIPLHHMRAKGFLIDGQIKAISPSLNDLTYIDVVTNSKRLQNFERTRDNLANELLELKETKPEGWERRVKEINALARRASNNIPKNLRGLVYFETLDEAGDLKPIGGNPYRALGKRKSGADIPFDKYGDRRKTLSAIKAISPDIPFDKSIDEKKKISALEELMTRSHSGLDPVLMGKAAVQEGSKLKEPLWKALKKVGSAAFSPAGAVGIWGATGGFDPSSGMDRAGLGAELAFSKDLVRGSQYATKGIKNTALRNLTRGFLNAGMPLKMALRFTRVATPLGWASLGVEGAYQLGKAIINERERVANLSEEERAAERAQHEEADQLAGEIQGAAEGGLMSVRQGFANGSDDPDENKKVDKGRRKFLKGLGIFAALPIVGKYIDVFQPLVQQHGEAIVKTVAEAPTHFRNLYLKILAKGIDAPEITTIEREIGKTYKDYSMTHHLDSGTVTIKKHTQGGGTYQLPDGEYDTWDGVVSEEVMEFVPKAEDIDLKTGRRIEYPSSYEEVTVRPSYPDGEMDDVSEGLDNLQDIIDEGQKID